jgi:biotin operon repressor
MSRVILKTVMTADRPLTFADVAAAISVTPQTARNYLLPLAARGEIVLRKVHGERTFYFARNEETFAEIPAFAPPPPYPRGQHKGLEGISATCRARVLAYFQGLDGGRVVTQQEIQVATGYSRSRTATVLRALMAEGVLVRITRGSGYPGKYLLREAIGEKGNDNEDEGGRDYRANLLTAVAYADAATETSRIKKLLASVVAVAVMDLRGDDEEKKNDARRWFQAPANGHPFTFKGVCEFLDIEEKWFLLKLKRELEREGDSSEGVDIDRIAADLVAHSMKRGKSC